MSKLRVKVLEVEDTQLLGANKDFKKRNLIAVTEGEYPETYCFEFVKDKVDMLDNILPDSWVTVHFNIKGRVHEPADKPKMYFTSLQGWKLEL